MVIKRYRGCILWWKCEIKNKIKKYKKKQKKRNAKKNIWEDTNMKKCKHNKKKFCKIQKKDVIYKIKLLASLEILSQSMFNLCTEYSLRKLFNK